MKESNNYIGLMDSNLGSFFNRALKVCITNPSLLCFLLRYNKNLKEATDVREHMEEQGVHVPPYMIASITNKCNLKCKGCYARAQKRIKGQELTADRWAEIFREAGEIGISIIFLAGGEPFTKPEVLDATKEFNDIIFPVFTNGTLIDDKMIMKLKKQKNLVPIISIEGYETDTDVRRGKGIYEHVRDLMKKLDENKVFFGASITVTSKNMETITSDAFIKELMGSGCRLFMFVEYVAVEEGTEQLILNDSKRSKLRDIVSIFSSKYNGLFVSFPGDEEQYGGCLAAGRGFVHVSPEGNLEPCPFSPYSDTSLKDTSLKEALQSEFLNKIRQEHGKLAETKGGCALWNNRDWVVSILNNTQSVDK